MIKLYRGHKHPDYLKTNFYAVCFSESRVVGNSYGLGQNDVSNENVKDGYLTIVELHAEIEDVPDRVGLDLFKNPKRIAELKKKYSAVRTRDRVVIVFDYDKLRNPLTVRAEPT
jgi:hypothetical protein